MWNHSGMHIVFVHVSVKLVRYFIRTNLSVVIPSVDVYYILLGDWGWYNITRCTRLAAAIDKVYQLLAHSRWFSSGTPASSTTKTGHHEIAEMKVVLNTTNQIKSNQIKSFDIIFGVTSPHNNVDIYSTCAPRRISGLFLIR